MGSFVLKATVYDANGADVTTSSQECNIAIDNSMTCDDLSNAIDHLLDDSNDASIISSTYSQHLKHLYSINSIL